MLFSVFFCTAGIRSTAFKARLDGDSHKDRAGKNTDGTKRGKSTENGEDKNDKRCVDACFEKQRPQQIVHTGHDKHTPECSADGGCFSAGKPKPDDDG